MGLHNKKKVWCCHVGCNTHSFEDKGTITWECFKHYENQWNTEFCPVPAKPPTTDEKIDLILEHLGLEIVTHPQTHQIIKKEKK